MADTPITPSVGSAALTELTSVMSYGLLSTVGGLTATGVAPFWGMVNIAPVGSLTIPTGDFSPTGAVVLNSSLTGVSKDSLTTGAGK